MRFGEKRETRQRAKVKNYDMQGPCWCGRVYICNRTYGLFFSGEGLCVLLLFGIKYNPSNDSRRNALCRNGTTRILYANLARANKQVVLCGLHHSAETCVHAIKKFKIKFRSVLMKQNAKKAHLRIVYGRISKLKKLQFQATL